MSTTILSYPRSRSGRRDKILSYTDFHTDYNIAISRY